MINEMIFIIVSNSSYKWIRQVTDAEEIFANCRSDMTYIHIFFNSQNSIIRKQQPNSKHRQNICCGWIWNAAHRLTVNVDSPAGGVIHGGQGGVGRGMLTQSWFPEHCLCSWVPWTWTPSPCASPSMHSHHALLSTADWNVWNPEPK